MLCPIIKYRNLFCHKWTSKFFSMSCAKNSVKKSSVIKPQNILNLHKRGLLEDIFPNASVSLPEQLLKQQCFYCGFDPTSDSLHIGNLMSLMLLLHCQRAGHNVIAVIGNATARIGDPSDQTKDRNSVSTDVLDKNTKGLINCITNIFETHEQEHYIHRGVKELPTIKILNNYDWYRDINVVDFFANAGRKFRMGPMLDKRFVKERLNSSEGLLLPEFLYQVYQAYDWLHLLQNYNCRFQFGGSDQLGNMNAGRYLIDRVTQQEVYGLLTPLITTHTGQKVGKTAGNAVWLDADKTSPFEFYQYFLRQRDADVEKFLKYFTFIELTNIKEIMQEHSRYPKRRNAQKILAKNVCKLVHGEEGLKSAERCTQVLFHGQLEQLENLTDQEIDATFKGMKIHHAVLEPTTTIYDIATKIKAIPDGPIGIEAINKGGVLVNGIAMQNSQQILLCDFHVLKNDLSLITVGKKNHHIVRWRVPDDMYQVSAK
ncbi:tyrosine--tRNA ligase, mitochondrial-like [Styela clava]